MCCEIWGFVIIYYKIIDNELTGMKQKRCVRVGVGGGGVGVLFWNCFLSHYQNGP